MAAGRALRHGPRTGCALAQWLNAAQSLAELRTWIATLGAWGPLVFGLIYVVGVVAVLPGSALTAAGALFGSVVGVTVAITAATIGASVSFLIARYYARDATLRWLCGKERFRRLNRLIAHYGAVAVLLTRLSPFLPFFVVVLSRMWSSRTGSDPRRPHGIGWRARPGRPPRSAMAASNDCASLLPRCVIGTCPVAVSMTSVATPARR